MKRIKLLAIGACAALAITTLGLQSATAQDEHKEHGEKMTVPDTAEGIMQDIHKQHSELDAVVKSKKLSDVHHHAFAIRDLANALPAKVAPDKKARVEGSAKNISKLAEDLDGTGDANDQAGTEANMKKLDGVLMALEKQVK